MSSLTFLLLLALACTYNVLRRVLLLEREARVMAAEMVHPYGWQVRATDIELARGWLQGTLLPWVMAALACWVAAGWVWTAGWGA
jgi:hypothetical protein